jgi:metallo-beta-lactamase class B
MNNRCLIFLCGLLLSFGMAGGQTKKSAKSYLTLDEAPKSLQVQEAAAKLAANPGESPELWRGFKPPYRSIEPIKLFDNLYFVGTNSVGAFVVDTGDGLVMLDTGCGDTDVEMMVNDMKKLGLNPSKIKLILISHEHFDHYGGAQYLKKNVCPEAKVAMSLVGWNLLQSMPMFGAFIGVRPQSVDVFMSDGMKIRVGNTTFQIVSTPGHSPGCLSFIFPVTDFGVPHVVGIMGGSSVQQTQTEAGLYKSSVEYFKAIATAAKCDAGLFFHSQEKDFAALRLRKPGEANPLIIGTEKFDSVYLQSFRNRYREMIKSADIKPY